VEIGIGRGLPRLCSDGHGGRDYAPRLGELAGGSLCFGQKGKHSGRTGLASGLGGERHATHDLGERAELAR